MSEACIPLQNSYMDAELITQSVAYDLLTSDAKNVVFMSMQHVLP